MTSTRPRGSAVTLLLSVLLGLSLSAQAQMRVEVVPLQHRFARDVVPVVEPLLTAGGTVTGVNDQLVVKTTPENLAEIRTVLAAIDRPLRRLRISVRTDESRSAQEMSQSLEADAHAGDLRVSARDGDAGRGGVSVQAGSDDATVRYEQRHRTQEGGSTTDYELQALEGQPAFIRAGTAVPIHARTVYAPGGTLVVQDTVDYYDADSGVWVLPRVAGDTVTLAIAPRSASVAGGRPPAFDVQSASTTVSGRLGQWIDLGGIQASRSNRGASLTGTTRTSENTGMSLQVRVEEVP